MVSDRALQCPGRSRAVNDSNNNHNNVSDHNKMTLVAAVPRVKLAGKLKFQWSNQKIYS